MLFQAAKRSEMCSVFMKRLGFDDTQDLCFEDWKRSHIGCSALLYGRFAHSQESRVQASKYSNMGSIVLKGGHFANIYKFCFQAAKVRYGLCRAARRSVC